MRRNPRGFQCIEQFVQTVLIETMIDPSSINVPETSGTCIEQDQRPSLLHRLKALLGAKGESTREGIRELIEDGRADHLLRPEEQRIIGNLVSLNDTRVDDVMVPRADIVGLSCDLPLEDIVRRFVESGYSRLPLYRESLDDVRGMVHIKDLMQFWGATGVQPIDAIVRDVIFVPPNMPVLDLLMRIQNNGVHMALVIDEYGGVDGLLTIEDLVEAVVGEIADLYDRTLEPEIRPQSDGSLIVDARVEVSELESHTGLSLLDDEREEDIDTIGGLAFALADRVPVRGEELAHSSGMRLIIMSADPRRIHTLRVILPTQLDAT